MDKLCFSRSASSCFRASPFTPGVAVLILSLSNAFFIAIRLLFPSILFAILVLTFDDGLEVACADDDDDKDDDDDVDDDDDDVDEDEDDGVRGSLLLLYKSTPCRSSSCLSRTSNVSRRASPRKPGGRVSPTLRSCQGKAKRKQ